MRAAWYRKTGAAADVLEVGEMPTIPGSPPGPEEVEIRLHASGINPADVKRRAGWGGSTMDHERVVPHADGAGVVVSVGTNVRDLREGQRVWVHNAQGGYGVAGRAFGTAAESVVLSAEQVFELPDAMGFAEGACLGIPALTAYLAVHADGPVQGQTVLVTGAAGAVGHFAAQFAQSAGARVIATVSTEDKAIHVARTGVSDVLQRHDDDLAERILDLTDGAGVDRIVEVDFGANLDTTTKLLKPGSVVAAYSSTAVPEPVLPYYSFAFRGATLRFIQGFLVKPETVKAALAEIKRLSVENRLNVAIDSTFGLDEIIEAHQRVESGETIGNVVLNIAP